MFVTEVLGPGCRTDDSCCHERSRLIQQHLITISIDVKTEGIRLDLFEGEAFLLNVPFRLNNGTKRSQAGSENRKDRANGC